MPKRLTGACRLFKPHYEGGTEYAEIRRRLTHTQLKQIAHVVRCVGGDADAKYFEGHLGRSMEFGLIVDLGDSHNFDVWDGDMAYPVVCETFLEVLERAGYSTEAYFLKGGELPYTVTALHDDGEDIDQLASCSAHTRAHAAAGLMLWLRGRVCPWPRGKR